MKTDQNFSRLHLTGGTTLQGAAAASLDWTDAGGSATDQGTDTEASTTNKLITLLVAGYYLVLFHGCMTATTTAETVTCEIRKDGVVLVPAVKQLFTGLTDNLDALFSLHTFGYFGEGDTISVYTTCSGANDVTPTECQLTVIKIGG